MALRNVVYLCKLIILCFAVYSANTRADIIYLHADLQGSIVAESNEAGKLNNIRHYSAYGEQLKSNKSGVGYTGHVYDNDIELTYMQARYYDPVIGRFYSNDPIDSITHLGTQNGFHGFNRYTYANNNPYRFIDPDGQQVRGTYNLDTGIVSMRDMDTKQRIKIMAESGGKPWGAPIEPGIYDILYTPREDFYRLEPVDVNFGDDTHDLTGRNEFRLHLPGATIGCIAALDNEGWSKIDGMLSNTTTTEVTVNSKSRNPFAAKTESSVKFGTIKVYSVSGRLASRKLDEVGEQ